MPVVHSIDSLVIHRILEYCQGDGAWHRRLWAIGSHLQILEVLEASQAVRDGILSASALEYLQNSAMGEICSDPAIGSAAIRNQIREDLKARVVYEDLRFFKLRELQTLAHRGYLQRWAEICRSAPSAPPIELWSRRIASHLLDSGLSREFISQTIRSRDVRPEQQGVLPDVLDELDAALSTAPREYEGIFPLKDAPRKTTTTSSAWMDASQTAAWLHLKRFSTSKMRIEGAVRIVVRARDPFAAVEAIRDVAERIVARSICGGDRPILHFDSIYVEGLEAPQPFKRPRRGVSVKSLDREDRVYSIGDGWDPIDHSIHLLSSLDDGPLPAAVATGWAAIEPLFMMPNEAEDNVKAADRVAAIAACSFPRAELTKLSYLHRDSTDALSRGLRQARSNLERVQLVIDHMTAGRPLDLLRVSDRIAEMRMKHLLESPASVLGKVHRYITMSLRRFYRQRNLILHGGRTSSVALGAALRSAAPLIGAGIDRVHHASIREKALPVAVAARAQLNLALLENRTGRVVSELLEPYSAR